MPREASRRRFLRTLAAVPFSATGVSALGGRVGAAPSSARSEGFDPTVHGLGFRNWSTEDPTFPSHDHTQVTEAEIRRTIKRDWKKPLQSVFDVGVSGLPSVLINTIAEQVYVTANQLSASNGHCYGMVFTAQQYFERPQTIPVGRDVAGDIDHPEAPIEDPEHGPVAEDIDLYQTSQALNLYAWLGRRNLVYPKWIDYDLQLVNLTAVVDHQGSAGITIYDPKTKLAHQVLVYDYDRSTTGTRLFLYDPNFPARFYRKKDHRKAASIFVDTSGSRLRVKPYKTGFQGPGFEEFEGFGEFVYNRWDRAIRARSDPSQHLVADVSAEDLRQQFLALTVFKTDTSDVSLAVSGPEGDPVSRLRSNGMDRRQTECHAMRYRYGAPDGEYHVAVTGRHPTEYTLETSAADMNGELLSSTVTTSIEAGQTHAYTVTVPESPDGDSGVERGAGGLPEWLKLTAAAATGVVAGGIASTGLGSRSGGQ